jgi:hypothetical protein
MHRALHSIPVVQVLLRDSGTCALSRFDGKEKAMNGHAPTIYVRNVFRMKWDEHKDYGRMFIEGKRHFIASTQGSWSLVAAFAEWPLFEDGRIIQPRCEMIQIWRIQNWQTLYDTMVQLSETEWYRELGESLASEDQELLINAGVREPLPDVGWQSNDYPGYTYLYESTRPCDGCSHAYLREINWFDALMSAEAGWELVWCASQVTAQPAEFSLLWRVPNSSGSPAKTIPQELTALAENEHARYKRMMSLVQTTRRRILYPIYTERLAQLASGKHA